MTANRKRKLIEDHIIGCAFSATRAEQPAQYIDVNRAANDLLSNTLLLLRHTGMRIGECVDLSMDCLRPLGPNQWAIHVPLGKLKTERWVPVDITVCQLVERIRSLRPPTAPKTGRLILFRPRGRKMLVRRIRAALQDVVAAVGISARIVPHQFRHTYGTEMLRAGVNFAAVMKLLGHTSPDMTLEYLQITQQDLQREFHLALSHPRHLVPSRAISSGLSPQANLSGGLSDYRRFNYDGILHFPRLLLRPRDRLGRRQHASVRAKQRHCTE